MLDKTTIFDCLDGKPQKVPRYVFEPYATQMANDQSFTRSLAAIPPLRTPPHMAPVMTKVRAGNLNVPSTYYLTRGGYGHHNTRLDAEMLLLDGVRQIKAAYWKVGRDERIYHLGNELAEFSPPFYTN
jgi:uncharacterized protein (DUF2336 family)